MWRSGVGVMASLGVVYASGFIYAQWASGADLAAFLLAQRIMMTVSQFSQAPFYSKLPTFARLYATNDRAALLRQAQRAMRLSYWIFVVGVVSSGVLMPIALQFIGAKFDFVSALFWGVYAVAVFIERIGAMHMQLFSLSNRILWHVANGATGSMFLVLMVVLYPSAGTLAFPAAMLIAYAAIYTAFSLHYSYRHYAIKGLQFERYASFKPALALTFGLGLHFFFHR